MFSAFLDVSQTVVHTTEGNVGFPILYKDVAAVMAVFAAPMDAVVSLLRDTDLEPLPFRGGKPMIAVSFFRYDDTTIGAYNEGAVTTLVVRRGTPAPRVPALDMLRGAGSRKGMTYIFDLPVTTAIANAAGREAWGFPKFVTDIPFALQDGVFEASVKDPNGRATILSLSGKLGRGLRVPSSDMVLVSHLDGEPLRTRIDIKAAMYIHPRDGLSLRIGDSSHPMAERLRSLGLDGAAPILVQSTTRFRSRLHLGERMLRAG